MTALTKQARETIKNYGWTDADRVTIAEYVQSSYPDGKWGGDRCIGFHHDNEEDCRCLEALLDLYVRERAR